MAVITDFDGDSDDQKTALGRCHLSHIDSDDVQHATNCGDEYSIIPSISYPLPAQTTSPQTCISASP